MSLLLVNTPAGAQELIEVGAGGGYFDASRVLWDERTDGPLPAITLGGMVRVGNALVYDAGAMAAHNAAAFAPGKAIEIASYIETREKMCARVAGIGQRLARAGDTAGATSCDAVVNALLDVLAHPSVTGATDIDALKLALKTRYLTAVSLASASAKAEFKRYDK